MADPCSDNDEAESGRFNHSPNPYDIFGPKMAIDTGAMQGSKKAQAGMTGNQTKMMKSPLT